MSPETFRRRLEAGRANHHLYQVGGREGLVSVWKHGEQYVATWEECPPGAQYDESSYTRDEVHRFAGTAELLAFLSQQGLSPADFGP